MLPLEDSKSIFTSLTIPCQWHVPSLENMLKLSKHSSEDLRLEELYGVPVLGVVPDGRIRDSKSRLSLTRTEAVQFNQHIHKNGLKFSYLLNAPYTLDSERKVQLSEYLDWIVNDFKADSLTISSLDLMRFVRESHPDVGIKVSTIAGLLTAADLNDYLSINPEKIVMHHDANRNFYELSKVIEKTNPLNIGIELMTTESCIRGCHRRDNHYTTISKGRPDLHFHMVCNSQKISYPAEFLNANLIRPEDILFYEEMGIRSFKITGRSRDPNKMPKVLEAHLSRSYEGNLINLTGIDPNLNAESFVYINNKALDGFIENFPRDQRKEKEYCNGWIIKLWEGADFKVEGANYKVIDNQLVCTKLPSKLKEAYNA